MNQPTLIPDDIGRILRPPFLARWKAEIERRRIEAEHQLCPAGDDDHCKHCRCEDCLTWERVWLAALTGKTRPATLPFPPGTDPEGAAAEIASLEAMLDEL